MLLELWDFLLWLLGTGSVQDLCEIRAESLLIVLDGSLSGLRYFTPCADHYSNESSKRKTAALRILCVQCPPLCLHCPMNFCSLVISCSQAPLLNPGRLVVSAWVSFPCTVAWNLTRNSRLEQSYGSLCYPSPGDHFPSLPDIQGPQYHRLIYFVQFFTCFK